MEIIKQPWIKSAVAIFAAAGLLLLPFSVHALGFGSVKVVSRLGQPLLAEVELVLDAGEQIDESCLSLSVPADQPGALRGYFHQAQISIEPRGAGKVVVISSVQPFDELFATVQLQLNCPGMGSLSRLVTILPELVVGPADFPVAANHQVENERPVEMERAQVPVPATATPLVNHPPVHQAAQPRHRRTETHRKPSVVHRPSASGFMLKLSSGSIDESRIGKITPQEREQLLEQQKLLDADDQTAKFLELQHQVKELQSELELIRVKLASIEGGATVPVGQGGRTTADAVQSAGVSVQQPVAESSEEDELTPSEKRKKIISGGLRLAGVLLLIFAVVRGYRYLSERHSSQEAERPLRKTVERRNEEYRAGLPRINLSRNEPRINLPHDEADDGFATNASAAEDDQRSSAGRLAEETSMLEEAELYASHGHANKAIEILREVVDRNPVNTDAWVLMMSILSSQGKVVEFERAARNFLTRNPFSDSWKMIQALGRTLDDANPLYSENKNLDATAAQFLQQLTRGKKRMVGDILVEMGAITGEELSNCMADFDPKKHGRLGGYLVARKMVTHAQLNDALLIQQGAASEMPLGARLTLRDMEDFMSGFNPESGETIADFLVGRGVITSTQLNKILHQSDEAGESTSDGVELDDAGSGSDADDMEFLWDNVSVRNVQDGGAGPPVLSGQKQSDHTRPVTSVRWILEQFQLVIGVTVFEIL